MAPTLRLVAWSSAEEFRYVAQCISECLPILSQSPDTWNELHRNLHQTVLLHLEVWRSRVPEDKLPRAVRCTQELFCAFIGLAPGLHLAVARFVALMTGEAQERTDLDYALPMHALAGRMGLPTDLVDLRHDISHGGHLPSQHRMEDAAHRALHFLWTSFWLPNMKAYESRARIVDETREQLTKLLTEYCRLSGGSAKRARRPDEKQTEVKRRLKSLLGQLRTTLEREVLPWRDVCHLLWQPGLLLSSWKGCQPHDLVRTLKRWKQVLELLGEMEGALPALIDTCFLSLAWDVSDGTANVENETELHQRQLCNWSRTWLLVLESSSLPESKTAEKNDILYHFRNWNSLGRDVCQSVAWGEIVAHLINCRSEVVQDLLPRVLSAARSSIQDFLQLDLINVTTQGGSTNQPGGLSTKTEAHWKVDPGQAYHACGWGILPPLFCGD